MDVQVSLGSATGIMRNHVAPSLPSNDHPHTTHTKLLLVRDPPRLADEPSPPLNTPDDCGGDASKPAPGERGGTGWCTPGFWPLSSSQRSVCNDDNSSTMPAAVVVPASAPAPGLVPARGAPASDCSAAPAAGSAAAPRPYAPSPSPPASLRLAKLSIGDRSSWCASSSSC